MNIKEMIAEWKRGCSCAPKESPEDCQACTRALIDAIERKLALPQYQIAEGRDGVGIATDDAIPCAAATALQSRDAEVWRLLTAPVRCEGEITFDRFAADGAFEHVRRGDFVWVEGQYGAIEIPRLRCEVIRSDSLSITVWVPSFKPDESAG
jgi:hypothetical protein